MQNNKIEEVTAVLPIDEGLETLGKARLVQQIGIIMIFTFIVLAALGMFGTGILSNRQSVKNGDTLSYDRFVRNSGESSLTFNLVSRDSVTLINIPVSYLRFFRVDAIVPEPRSSTVSDNQYSFLFDAKKAYINFYLVPTKNGAVNASIRANNTTFKLSHFIYP